ncbi:MAG: bifunctional adenosylcobinamide kinase/adenosylcobinamide-phosphate guanylyltransferase [Deltaproteobacteria bacterium]|nr:bifunctional adenosylcobinamide kinase/adenosylcobinamide-phosphate guanylyltransferase [Deltaproteobacteria bacterium]
MPNEASRDDRRFVFVVGGARSGKSAFALKLSDEVSGKKVYLATGVPIDAEMEERIKRHREERPLLWETVEERRDIRGGITAAAGGVALIDCLTIWIANLMEDGLNDAGIVKEAEGLVSACRVSASSVVVVSNEVGCGIVPDNALARRFRDISGIVNQMFAEAAPEVWFVASGIPLRMK